MVVGFLFIVRLCWRCNVISRVGGGNGCRKMDGRLGQVVRGWVEEER